MDNPLVRALFLSLLVNRIIEGVARPVRKQWPSVNLWWLIYVAWLVGGLLAFLADINLVPELFPDPLVGRVVSAVIIGGGANLIKSIFSALEPKLPDTTTTNISADNVALTNTASSVDVSMTTKGDGVVL